MNYFLKLTNPPKSFSDTGEEGQVAINESYFYIYSHGGWRHAALSSLLSQDDQLPLLINANDREGFKNNFVTFNSEYFFVYFNGWKNVAISPINPLLVRKAVFSPKYFVTDLRISPAPVNQIAYATDGMVGFDKYYFYIYVGRLWRKFNISKVGEE